jgi:Skp family chaperone for outer membrane proteins
LAFGSTKETQEFYDKKRTALSKNQTKQVEASPDIKKAYESIMKVREYKALQKKYEEKINKATGEEKTRLYKEFQKKLNELYKK